MLTHFFHYNHFLHFVLAGLASYLFDADFRLNLLKAFFSIRCNFHFYFFPFFCANALISLYVKIPMSIICRTESTIDIGNSIIFCLIQNVCRYCYLRGYVQFTSFSHSHQPKMWFSFYFVRVISWVSVCHLLQIVISDMNSYILYIIWNCKINWFHFHRCFPLRIVLRLWVSFPFINFKLMYTDTFFLSI